MERLRSQSGSLAVFATSWEEGPMDIKRGDGSDGCWLGGGVQAGTGPGRQYYGRQAGRVARGPRVRLWSRARKQEGYVGGGWDGRDGATDGWCLARLDGGRGEARRSANGWHQERVCLKMLG